MFQVLLKYPLLPFRLPAHLWKFATQELATAWCNSHQPPHPSSSTWQVVNDKGKIVASGPWTWETK